MSKSESDSNRPDGRGRSEGSRKTQWAADRQPEERRKPALRKNLRASLLAELRQPVTLSIGGKFQKVEYLQALLCSISRDLLKGSLSERLKFLGELDRLKLTSLLTDQAKLDQERAEVAAESRALARERHHQRLITDGLQFEKQQLREKWYVAAKFLVEVRAHCDWPEGTERLADDVDFLCQDYQSSLEIEENIGQIMKNLRALATMSIDDDDDHVDDWQEGGDYDESREGAVDYDLAEFDESAMPATNDPNDPALDLNIIHRGLPGFDTPASFTEGED